MLELLVIVNIIEHSFLAFFVYSPKLTNYLSVKTCFLTYSECGLKTDYPTDRKASENIDVGQPVKRGIGDRKA